MPRSLFIIRNWFTEDARHFQIISQLIFLCYGLLALGWDHDFLNYLAAFTGAVGTQTLFICAGAAPSNSLKSALITTLGLSLLLKANSPWIFLIAASISIAQKFAFRFNGKHLWNPAVFGIILSILISGEAWISPAQWGSTAVLVFIIGTAGLGVLSKVKRLETGIAFLLTLAILEYIRSVVFLGWDHEVFLHRLTAGSVWLFSFFMITDPMTIPAHRTVRICWSICVAVAAFYLGNFMFIPTAPIWVLAAATPLTPLLDLFFRGKKFTWIQTTSGISNSPIKSIAMKQLSSVIVLIAALFISQNAIAFCGFYVAKADATLFNNRSEVILVRDGMRTVITMSNDFKGDVRDFAMVVPVPVVLKESDIRIVNRNIFEKLDAYSSPRLVEYYDSNPCNVNYEEVLDITTAGALTRKSMVMSAPMENDNMGVTIEASYSIGEYDILILSATESSGLRDWLIQNEYRIPATADEVLLPYIKSNTKFFVVKVNLERLQASGFDYLNPIQISFEHAKFMLPIRLGMANSQGTQDLIVYAFTRSGRVECTNYRTVKMPSDRNIPLFVRENFGDFYKNTFEKSWRGEGRNAIFLEYAWNVSPSWGGMKCDPCVGPPPLYEDLTQAGVWWVADWNNPGSAFFTRMHVRYGRDRFPADLNFQVTPNTENYQARYILTHPAGGPFDCPEAQSYLEQLLERRTVEIDELFALTGKPDSRSWGYIHAYDQYIRKEEKTPGKEPNRQQNGKGRGGPNPGNDGTIFNPEISRQNSEKKKDQEHILPSSDITSRPGSGSLRVLMSLFFILASVGILILSKIKPKKAV